MPVKVTVSQVREALYLAARRETVPTSTATTGLLGGWFHEGLSFLVSSESHPTPLELMRDSGDTLETWQATLKGLLYERFVGPRLTRHCALLQDSAAQLLVFWKAMQTACDWLAELSWTVAAQQSMSSRRGRANTFTPCQTLADYLQTDVSLSCEFHEPGWSDSVQLVGIADALLRVARTGAWCAVEFKTGQTFPEVDLAQAALYHLMLTRFAEHPADERPTQGDLAVISFQPDRHELLFPAAELRIAQQKLTELLGRLAGVSVAAPTVHADTPEINQPSTTHAVPTPPAPENLSFQELRQRIEDAYQEYGVTVRVGEDLIVGPTFIRFPLALGSGTKVAAVEKLTPELQIRLQLAAKPFVLRDEGQLVVDVQRQPRLTVDFGSIRDQLPKRDPLLGSGVVPVGVNLFGRLECADLSRTEHAHLLVAGTTGSGKSEWLRTAVAGLILANTPDTLRLVLIDPKRNAFHALKGSPYLWEPIVFPDETPAVDALKRLCDEMETRYRRMEGADTIADVVRITGKPIPRIVCVCDEYRDLISHGPKERKAIETQICRLGAKARAAGIHLILATQEPSRTTITGALDSNMPARVGLRMGKNLESQMLLQQSGAEKLLGHGDLLFKDTRPPQRLQAPYLSETDRQQIYRRPDTNTP